MLMYVNGEYVEREKAVISPFDHGYLYGLGVFETFRVYEGHPFLLHNHLQRLQEGLEVLNIQCEVEEKRVIEILKKLLHENNLTNAYVRFNVSAGNGEIGLQTDMYQQPTVICFMKALMTPSTYLVEKNIQIVTLPRNTPEGFHRLKSHHYLNNILAKREVGPSMDVEGIFLTREGYLAEGVVSNLFFVKDGIVHTPSLDTGILNGITRQYVMSICKERKIEVREGLYTKEQLLECDEVFLTNSIQEIVSVKEVEGRKKASTITSTLYSSYQQDRFMRWSI